MFPDEALINTIYRIEPEQPVVTANMLYPFEFIFR